MDHFGFIHEKLDIKILILFILRRLPNAVDGTVLSDMCRLCDEGVGYFDYTDCLAELIDNELITEDEDGIRITDKGSRNVELVETSIPFSVRKRAAGIIRPEQDRMRRDNMIRTTHSVEKNGCFVELAMSDGEGDVIHLRLLCGGEEQAERMKKNFRKNAESYYQKIVEMLSSQ